MGCFGYPVEYNDSALMTANGQSKRLEAAGDGGRELRAVHTLREDSGRPVIRAIREAHERRARLVPCPLCGKSFTKPRAQALHNFHCPKKRAADGARGATRPTGGQL